MEEEAAIFKRPLVTWDLRSSKQNSSNHLFKNDVFFIASPRNRCNGKGFHNMHFRKKIKAGNQKGHDTQLNFSKNQEANRIIFLILQR